MRKRNVAALQYANVVLHRVVWESRRKQPGDSAVLATEYSIRWRRVLCQPLSAQQRRPAYVSKILQVSKMQQSHVPPKKGSLRSHVWSKDTQGEEAANNKANHKNDNFLNCD